MVTCIRLGHLSPFYTSIKIKIRDPVFDSEDTLLKDLSTENTYKYTHKTQLLLLVYILCVHIF